MTAYLGNAFSLNMLEIAPQGLRVEILPVPPAEIPPDARSIIGHADMAALVSGILNRHVEANRESVILKDEDVLFVAQYRGPRLPAGATQLPEGAVLEFYRIAFWR